MITLENWRQRMSADMRLRDYRPRTRGAYELATRLFLDWAKTHQKEIIEPDFYVRIKGDEWVVPGVNTPNAPAAAPAFVAEQYLTADSATLMTLTQQQRQEVARLKAERARQARPAPSRGRAAPRAPAGGGEDLAPLQQYPFAIDDADRRRRPVVGYPGADPLEVSERRIANNRLHAPERARRARTSASVRNFGFGSAKRHSTSAACSSVRW